MVLLHGNLQCTVKQTGHKKDVFQSMMQIGLEEKNASNPDRSGTYAYVVTSLDAAFCL